MVRIVREADKVPVADVAKKHKVSTETVYQWRRKFGGMDVDDARRLKVLERRTLSSRSCSPRSCSISKL